MKKVLVALMLGLFVTASLPLVAEDMGAAAPADTSAAPAKPAKKPKKAHKVKKAKKHHAKKKAAAAPAETAPAAQ